MMHIKQAMPIKSKMLPVDWKIDSVLAWNIFRSDLAQKGFTFPADASHKVNEKKNEQRDTGGAH